MAVLWAVPRHCDRQGGAERCPLERLVENNYMEGGSHTPGRKQKPGIFGKT